MAPPQIAHYRITAKLGQGGMGEVYRATDMKLGREVAIKILPESFAGDPARMARFEREAKVLALLNHPNIAQIYGVEDRALVMELVEGETLAGPLPLETALDYARQMADALEYAHERGVVHRDLKPANIKVTPEGKVKVLDFGLAKATEEERAGNPETSPTLTLRQTQMGTLLGTAAYMAPEQARGRAVDKRADIWAFGVVLYEILTGRRLFEGETVSDTLASVLKTEPDLTLIPPKVHRLLESCLEKDLRRRLRDIGDAWRQLDETPADRPLSPPRRLAWLATALFALTSVALGVVAYRHVSEEQRVLKLSALLPMESLDPGSTPAVSPDGHRVAFTVPRSGIWIRDLDALAARPLPGTERAIFPFWSPSGRSLGFFADGKLKRLDIGTSSAAGPPTTLCDAANGRGGSWSKTGVIIFSPNPLSGLFRVPETGGTPAQVTTLGEALGHRAPWFLPDSRRFLYTARFSDPAKTAVYVGDVDGKTTQPVLPVASNAVYVPPGYLLFVRGGTLLAQSFNAGAAKVTGEPIVVADRVDYFGGESQGQFGSSQTGVLAYLTGTAMDYLQLTWFDRSGKNDGTVGTPGILNWPAISPDGRTIAYHRMDLETGVYDIWLHDLSRGTNSRFTSKGGLFPAWSPDGKQIAFIRNPGRRLYRKPIGSSNEELLDSGDRPDRPEDWSTDGRYIIEGGAGYTQQVKDIWVLPLFGNLKPFLYLHSEALLEHSRLSPDGRWLAYVSNETGRNEVYVQSFPKPARATQISIDGGGYPRWRRDGKELFFISADQKMMGVPVNTGASFEVGVPKALFEIAFEPGSGAWYDVSKDDRFLIPATLARGSGLAMTIVVNWTEGLKK
jgi:Tol biopolymer transport system component/predicted Ser/Thr protein kinase